MFSSKRTGGGALQKVFTQRRIVCQARGTIERFDPFIVPVQQKKQMAARGPIGLVIRCLVRGNLFKGGKSNTWFAGLRNLEMKLFDDVPIAQRYSFSLPRSVKIRWKKSHSHFAMRSRGDPGLAFSAIGTTRV